MAKSVYSLILTDEVIRGVDRLAYEAGTSRSNLIDRLLAKHLSILTPEMRVAEIFRQIQTVTGQSEALQVLSQPSGAMLVLRGAIAYKYNPTIRYSVEILSGEEAATAQFRAVSRTQSPSLLQGLTAFFHLWTQVERTCLSARRNTAQLQYEIDGGRFLRTVSVAGGDAWEDEAAVGQAMGNYIQSFDRSMNLFFAAGCDPDTAGQIQQLYWGYLENSSTMV